MSKKAKKLSLIKNEAKKRGIICVSKAILSSKSKLTWKCEQGHIWYATYSNAFRHRRPCSQCRGRRTYSLALCQDHAKKRDGRFLSKKFIGGRLPHLWQCEDRHTWKASPFSVISNNNWCRICSFTKTANKLRFSIGIAKSIAKNNGGECLSKQYINCSQKLKWRCQKNHKFLNTLDHVKNGGQWCPFCIGKNININDMKKLASERGGKCLSKSYVNSEKPLEWECSLGHRWQAISNGMKSGKWCPHCTSGIGESICRLYFEKIFHEPFPRSRPKWLIGPAGRPLELDGYNQELKIAFEHHGSFHYKKDSFFHDTEKSFGKRQDYDKWKKRVCNKNGVRLVIIPDVLYILGVKNLPSFLNKIFRDLKLGIGSIENIKININTAYSSKILEELRAIAKRRGGLCLESSYLNMHSKMSWKCCKCNHVWQAVPMSVKKGSWCPNCAGHNVTIDVLLRHAKEKKGKLISNVYQNNTEKLEWQCKEGHNFFVSWSSVKPNSAGRGGSWCPTCFGTPKKTIDEMQKMAERFGGKCLSKSYEGMHKKIKWKCSNGHEFQMCPSSIWHKGSWCQLCSNVRRAKSKIKYSIKELRQFAKVKNGSCLSKEYLTCNLKYKWKCMKDHQWDATWINIKRGRWCPICAMKQRVQTRHINKLMK